MHVGCGPGALWELMGAGPLSVVRGDSFGRDRVCGRFWRGEPIRADRWSRTPPACPPAGRTLQSSGTGRER